MTERFPNLFLVGAMRAGTTALTEALSAHPDIHMSDFKEPAFFADPVELAKDSRIVSEAGFAGDVERYLTLFQNAGNVTYLGESSTHYTKLPRITDVAKRMIQMSPDARIIYLVRDPVERTLSHYRYAVRTKEENRSCLVAVQSEPIYCAVSDYARQIEPFLDLFGPEQVFVAVLEELATDPASGLVPMLTWLELPIPDQDLPFRRRNSIGGVSRTRGPDLLHRIGRTSSYQRMARHMVSERLRTAVRTRLHEPVHRDEVRHPSVLEYLQAVHEPQIETLESLLGRSFELWKTS